MSYGAILGIAILLPVLEQCFPCRQKWLSGCYASIAINIILFPITLWFFYVFPTYSFFINLFVLLIMMGCGLCAREGSLISLSLVYDYVNLKVKKVMVVIITIANTAFWVILLKTGIDKVLNQVASGKQTPSLLWPEWVFTIFLPIGAVFLILHTIEYCIDFLGKKEEEAEA